MMPTTAETPVEKFAPSTKLPDGWTGSMKQNFVNRHLANIKTDVQGGPAHSVNQFADCTTNPVTEDLACPTSAPPK